MTTQRRRNLCHKMPKQRMRPWLTDLIENGTIPGLVWINKAEKIFRIPWKHGSRHNWRQADADLFILWAQHRGKYNPNKDRIPNTKKYKATFRCAINSLPDCEEIVEKSQKSGHDAFKIYRFNECEKRKMRKIRKKEDNDEQISKDSFTSEERLIPNDSDSSLNEGIPRLEELFGDSLRTAFPNGGFYSIQNGTASKEISAQEYFEQIENSFTVEEMHTEIFLDDTYMPYAEEVTIHAL